MNRPVAESLAEVGENAGACVGVPRRSHRRSTMLARSSRPPFAAEADSLSWRSTPPVSANVGQDGLGLHDTRRDPRHIVALLVRACCGLRPQLAWRGGGGGGDLSKWSFRVTCRRPVILSSRALPLERTHHEIAATQEGVTSANRRRYLHPSRLVGWYELERPHLRRTLSPARRAHGWEPNGEMHRVPGTHVESRR